MQSSLRKIQDTDLLKSEVAMYRAAKKALELGKQTNTPVYVWENGGIVDLTKSNNESTTLPSK